MAENALEDNAIGFENADELVKAVDEIMAENPEHFKKLSKL